MLNVTCKMSFMGTDVYMKHIHKWKTKCVCVKLKEWQLYLKCCYCFYFYFTAIACFTNFLFYQFNFYQFIKNKNKGKNTSKNSYKPGIQSQSNFWQKNKAVSSFRLPDSFHFDHYASLEGQKGIVRGGQPVQCLSTHHSNPQHTHIDRYK